MSTPTNIPKTPMGGTEQDSYPKSKEKFQQQLQHIFQTTLRLTAPDQFDQLCQWMEYNQYLTIDDFFEHSYKDLEKFDTKGPATEYKVKGKVNHISPNVAQKLKSFVRWMTHEERPYELHDGFLATLTRESYLKFRHLDTKHLPTLPPSHHEPQQHMTSFPSELKQPTHSESKIALNNFKKGTKRDASVYPIFKNDKYYDTFQRSFLANLKAQGLYDVADPDYDPESGDIYEQELFQGKQSFVYSVLVASLQTEKGRELVKEFEGDARSIILKLHHYHTKSNVAQHDIITLTTDITNLTLNDSWKGTVRQFLSHFKEKLRLLDSLVPVSDQLPETTRITFLQRAVQQNHDLRQTLVNKCLAESGIDPTDIQNVMSVSHAKRNISSHDSSRKIHTHQRYVFTRVNQSNHHLIDRGANGGLAGADMRVIHTTPRKINIVGIDDHELTGLNVVTAAALLDTQKGPIIGIFHEYAHLGKGKSIHASGQMEWFNCQVDDRSKLVGGAQRVETPEGYVIPLSIETGLVYMHPIRIPTDQDLQMYPHVFFTSPDIWDPSVLDHEITPSLLEDITQHYDDSLLQESIFDEYGDLHHRAIQTLNIYCDLPSLPPGEPTTYAHLHGSNPVEEDWESLRPYFGWQSEQVIKDTYKVTSRFGGTIPRHDYLKKHFKSRNPVFNIPR